VSPSKSRFQRPGEEECPYLLVAVDEYSRSPFGFPCKILKSSIVIGFCLFCFASLVFLAASTAVGAHRLSVNRCGLTSPLEAFISALSPCITLLGTASANSSTKPFGKLSGCCCTDVVFPRIDGRRCWPKLFTPSDRLFSCLQMKRPTKDSFVFLGDP